MKSEKGFTLIEVLVGLTLISLLAVGYLSALTSSSTASIIIDRTDTARSLAQSQMEYIKKQPFASSYIQDAIPAEYTGYAVTINAAQAAERDSLIQTITITVTHNGQTITTLQDCKTK